MKICKKISNITDFKVNKRKQYYRRPTSIIVYGLLLLLSFSVAQANAERDKPLEKVSLQLSWYHEFHFAGYYAAQLKGYYQEEGLEVEIKERKPGLLPVDAVLAGDADFGNATSDIMFLRMQGKPVVALAVIMQHSPWILLVRADSGITVPEDLIGKTVSMDMSYRDAEIEAMFKDEYISTETMTIVRKEPGVENLINGTVDARVSYITSQPFELQEQGFAARVIRPVNYGVDFYGDTLFTSERQIREHPQRVAAFRRASLRGWQYAMDHPEELIDYIYSTYYADQTKATIPYSIEHLRFEAQVMAQDLMHPKLIQIGHMNPYRWQQIADTYASLGMAEPINTLKGFIYDPNPERDYKWVYWTIGIIVSILVIAGVCVAVLYVFNKRLNHDVKQRTSELTQTNKVLVQEISQRKQAEIQIRKLSRVVEQSPNIIVMTDTDGILEYVNPKFTQVTGYTFEEALGKTPRILKSCETPQEVYNQLWKTITSGREWKGEFYNRKKNGELFWESAYIIPIKNGEGKIINFVAIKEDTTESKRIEEELIKAQKLDSIGMLAGGIAHDFNNYLQGIMGYILLAQASSDDGVKKLLKEAEKLIFQSKDLSSKLITFSKGGDPIRKTLLISQLIKDSVALAMSASRFDCQIAVPDSLWPVDADKGQLGQVFSNIIINAKQAMPNGGKVETFAENIEVNKSALYPLKEGKYVKITIKDRGTGILHEDVQKIFDPYFTTKKSGNGLGLSTCFSIIKKHGGHISVESEPGVGTAFYIYLPASVKITEETPEPGVAKTESTGTASNDIKGKILVMDDEQTFRAVIGEHLKRLKYDVGLAEDGNAAISLYKEALEIQRPFDAVVMDLTVPGGMGGKEAVEELLKIDQDANAIITSCYVNDTTMSEYKKFGFRSALSKPYEIDELDETLQKVISEN